MKNTILFVETSDIKGLFICGYNLNNGNYTSAPKGKIRIARFNNNFNPRNSRSECYYGEIYLKLFVKRLKKYIINKKRNREKLALQCVLTKKYNFNRDLIAHISNIL